MKKGGVTNLESLGERMAWLRIAQLLINEEYRAGAFKVPIHLALGHEAIAIAVDAVMEEADRLLLTHRNIAYNLAREKRLQGVRDEYLLKKSGLAGGKLGSMNLANPRRGIPYTSSILGNNFAVATGVALALKQKGKGVAIVLGGDGSIEEGTFYESLVFAKSQNAPLLVLIENNEWSMSTHIDERRAPVHLRDFAKSIGIDFLKLSGNDVARYVEQLRIAKREAMRGPLLIEVHVRTLGDYLKEELGSKRVVNYHSGPAQEVRFDGTEILIKRSVDDPLFMLEKKIGKEQFRKMVRAQHAKIEKEV